MTDFHLLIIDWYRQNKRELPWRSTKDPYKIWLSEIILQQTRVDQGMNYYLKFIDHYPTVIDLAKATEEQVLNDWQGLGYYSRARNLHSSAKMIASNLNGEFPTTYKEILTLKGVGPYTAAAIASFCFNEAQAVVDGNVYRVLSRVYDIDTPIDTTKGTKEFYELANQLLPSNNPGEFNQAIMEFGALNCTPNLPACGTCIFNSRCLSLKNKTINNRPLKEKKTKIRKRYFTYFFFHNEFKTVIQKREDKDIWQNMYEFPLIESNAALSTNEINQQLEDVYDLYSVNYNIHRTKHILSHQHIHTTFITIPVIPKNQLNKSINFSLLDDFPLPRLIDRFLEEFRSEDNS